MAKRKRATPRDLEAQVWDELDKELDELVAAIAAEEGLAKGATRLSPEREVALWGQQDPMVDATTLRQQLLDGTVPPERYDPQGDRRFALLRLNEDDADEWAQAVFSGPLDEQMADLVLPLIEYPGRVAVLAPYADDPRALVAKADDVNARWLKRTRRVSEDDAPVPTVAGMEAY